MNENHVYDMIIVGGGPGGYTSALYAARAGLDTIVIEKLSAGGQMSLTWQIETILVLKMELTDFHWQRKCKNRRKNLALKVNMLKFLIWI